MVQASPGIDLLAVVQRDMPGVNIVQGARPDAVSVILPNPSADQFRRVIAELGLPQDLFFRMTQLHDEAVTYTATSGCCVAEWHWSSDDGLFVALRAGNGKGG